MWDASEDRRLTGARSGSPPTNRVTRVVAAVGAALTGATAAKLPLTNTCFFATAKDHELKLGGAYKPSPQGLTGLSGFLSQVGEDDATRRQTANEGNDWYAAIIKEMFS